VIDLEPTPAFDEFVPILAWPGRRPSHAELATWHEALRASVGLLFPVDLFACWLYPSRGGSILVGPPELLADRLDPPPAEPLVHQEGLYALEDRVTSHGYRSAMAIPIRAEVQDVGLLLVASLEPDAYTLAHQRALHRVAGALATSCRRLAAQSWIVPKPAREEQDAIVAGITEGLLDAIGRARDGDELVRLASDALANQLPHDRLELLAVAPAPDCWAIVGHERGAMSSFRLDDETADAIDAMIHGLGAREVARVPDLSALDTAWPPGADRRGAARQRGMLAARLEMGEELIGWLWLGSETAGWFRPEDEMVARLAARILAPRVAAWEARAEIAGAWG
jgi:GAF domain-containing protein